MLTLYEVQTTLSVLTYVGLIMVVFAILLPLVLAIVGEVLVSSTDPWTPFDESINSHIDKDKLKHDLASMKASLNKEK